MIVGGGIVVVALSMTTERNDFDMKFLNQAVWAIGGRSRSGDTLDKYELSTNVETQIIKVKESWIF